MGIPIFTIQDLMEKNIGVAVVAQVNSKYIYIWYK